MDELLRIQEQFLERIAKLEEREAQWRSALANAPTYVATVDRNRTLQFLNRAPPGMTFEDFIGKTVDEIVLPEYHGVVRENLQHVFQTGEIRSFELVAAGPNGQTVWYETHLGPLKLGDQIVAATVTAIDITKRKQAEDALKKARDELERRVAEALRQSEEKYRGLLEACPDAVVMTDMNGTILFASRQTWSMVGIPESEDMVGQRVFNYVIEEDRRRLAENMSRLATAGIRKHTEYTALRRDGKTIPTEISSALNRDAKGQPVALLAVIRDITERKLVHETLQREHHTLKHLLQSSDHERQLIAYEIHDGLAQHLAGAIMQFQTFQYLKETKPKEAVKAFDAGMTILQQGHFEARRLISGVRPPILDEEGVVAAVAHLVNEQSRLRGADIEYRSRVNFDRLSPTLENTIYRITQEGLANACQHSKSQKIRVSLVQKDDRIRIEIRDWGIGFDTSSMHENRFGLEGIRQRVRLLGGKCSIRSKAGKGTRIRLELPVVARD
jgi:PAS domain S-box-containing protein